MIFFFFSCLQGVQTQSNQTQLEEACMQVCNQYKSVCTQEQSCDSLCVTISIQVSTRSCDVEAQNLWGCQSEGEWECAEGLPSFVGEACSTQEGLYLECMTPEDTGSLSN